MSTLTILAILATAVPAVAADAGSAPDYATCVAPIFKQYCVGCHNDEDREGEVLFES